MDPTSLSSQKTTISTLATTSNSIETSSTHSSCVKVELPSHSSSRNTLEDNDQASSGDEWDMEIGNLIIDLDADLEKDEMKEKGGSAKNDIRNSNNNNSMKGSNNANGNANAMNSQGSKLPTAGIQTAAKNENTSQTKNFKNGIGTSSFTQNPGKSKSKSKKSKGTAVSKHGNVSVSSSNSKVSKSDMIDLGLPETTNSFSPLPAANVSVGKSKSSDSLADSGKTGTKLAKSGRNYKKQNKNINPEKKSDAQVTPIAGVNQSKEGREKPAKPGKGNRHHHVQHDSSTFVSVTTSISAHSMPTYVSSATSLPSNNDRKSPSYQNPVGKFSSHCSEMSADKVSNSNGIFTDKGQILHSNEAPVMSAIPHLGSHRKTSSVPSPMKFQTHHGQPNSGLSAQCQANVTPRASLPLSTTVDSPASQSCVSGGKRDRNSASSSISQSTKKIKLEKEGKSYNSGMTPTDGETLTKPTTLSSSNDTMTTDVLSLPGTFSNLKSTANDYKILNDKSDKKMSLTTRTALSSVTTNSKSNTRAKASVVDTSNIVADLTEREGAVVPQNNVSNVGIDKSSTRTIGTDTTFADVAVETEPESLGPCDPGTHVNLSGIVWHEAESGVLVVNVTWRNRSYIGTLIDTTKHALAPPRMPDVDSDVEYRVKTGRPKRQRGNGNNGSGLEGGRKGRKSLVNNGDEYKCSPSSNKRRSAKMSESEACSGNDGEICTTPSKSSKRARMSRSAKQKTQKTVHTTIVRDATSGDGTSGSGSSACSSPVFIECPFANCEKRYKDSNALKYHEAHAHPDGELSGTEEAVSKSPDAADSPDVESPKGSENMSTKSTEEMSVSDSTGSPDDNNNVAASNVPDSMDTNQAETNNESPFVIDQPSTASNQKQYIESYTASNQPNSISGKGIQNVKDVYSETKNHETNTPDRTVSPYTLTDSQPNDSISLKNHATPTVTLRPNHNTRPTTTTYGDPAPRQSVNLSDAAADSESALAVKTLLQLQDSQDQLPGLTPYQASQMQPVTSQMVTTAPPVTVTSPMQQHPVVSVSSSGTTGQPTSTSSVPSLKTQSMPNSPFRAHGLQKEGAPLPRMSVGISTPRNSATGSGGQYVIGGYPTHGTVTTDATQEGMAHYTPSGLKTVKGKTVPIPTDPQQTTAVTSQQSHQSSNTAPGFAASQKKQKRKKPKTELSKLPVDSMQKPGFVHPIPRPSYNKEDVKQGQSGPDVIGVKQERLPLPSSYNKVHSNLPKAVPTSMVSGSSPRTANVKVEPDSNVPPGHPHHSRSAMNSDRPQIPPRSQTLAFADMPGTQSAPGNKNNNNKFAAKSQEPVPLPPQMSRHPYHQPQSASPSFSDASDKGEKSRMSDMRSKDRNNVPSGSSHSLPGSRSLTPISQAPRHLHGGRQHSALTQSNLQHMVTPPANRRPPSSKDAMSPPPPLERRLSVEGPRDPNKQIPLSSQRAAAYPASVGQGLFPPYPVYPGSELTSTYKYMNDPQFQQHFENVIQHVMQKDHSSFKEERPHSSRPRSTPSPNPQIKQIQTKSPRPEDRRAESPTREQNYPQPSVQMQTAHRSTHLSQHSGHHPPRVSPIPQSSFPSTPNKLGAASTRGLSPHPYASPSPMAGNRPPRPSSEAERLHRRDQSFGGDRPQTSSRMSIVTPGRKPVPKDNFSEHRPPSPEKEKSGPPATSVYAPPGMPMQALPGARPQVQYYQAAAFPPQIYDPRNMAQFFPAYAMFGHGMFPGHWPQPGAPSSTVPGAPDKPPSQSPHLAKPQRERSSSGSRSPYRDENERRLSRGEVRSREGDSYSNSKERRTSDGPSQARKSITPDPKATVRNPSGDGKSGTSTPPTHRHHHTHHHIHEGFPQIISPYQLAPVMAGPEAAALVQFPKRELP